MRTGSDRRVLEARVDDNGDLHVDGQDLGPATAMVSGDGEYEFFYTVRAEHIPQLLSILGGSPGDDILAVLEREWSGEKSCEFERMLVDEVVPTELFVYS